MTTARHQSRNPSDEQIPESADVTEVADASAAFANRDAKPKTAANDLVATIDVERDSIRAIWFGEPS